MPSLISNNFDNKNENFSIWFLSTKDDKFVFKAKKFVLCVGNLKPLNVFIVFSETNPIIIYICNLEIFTQYPFEYVWAGKGF